MKLKVPPKPEISPELLEAEKVARRLRLDDGLGFMVRVLSTRANLLYHELTGQDGITPRQFGALLTLYQQGSLTLTDLAERIRTDRSTLSEMVRRMADRGLVTKAGNGDDARSAKVSLTSSGKAALMRLVPGAAELQKALLAPLSTADRRQFLHCMKQVTDASGTQ